jgi:hypothetical protein
MQHAPHRKCLDRVKMSSRRSQNGNARSTRNCGRRRGKQIKINGARSARCSLMGSIHGLAPKDAGALCSLLRSNVTGTVFISDSLAYSKYLDYFKSFLFCEFFIFASNTATFLMGLARGIYTVFGACTMISSRRSSHT